MFGEYHMVVFERNFEQPFFNIPLTAKVLATCPVELYFPMETQRHDP